MLKANSVNDMIKNIIDIIFITLLKLGIENAKPKVAPTVLPNSNIMSIK